MNNRCKLDIKLGPFRLFSFPLRAKLVNCEDEIFGEGSSFKDLRSRRDTFLHSWPTAGAVLPDFHRDRDQIIYTTYRATRYWVATDGDFDAWQERLSRNTRQGLRRKRKKIAEADRGKLDIRRYHRPEEMSTFHRLARELSKVTFHEKKLGGGLPDHAAFVADLQEFAAKGLGHGSILFLDGQPISYLYSETQGRRCMPVYMGFDPRYKQLSPGLVHNAVAIEDAFRDPSCDVFDFGLTAFQHKEQLATDQLPCANVLVLSNTIRHRTAVALHRASARITAWAVRGIEAGGLKKPMQQWLRETI